jgi:hypothetical protein
MTVIRLNMNQIKLEADERKIICPVEMGINVIMLMKNNLLQK